MFEEGCEMQTDELVDLIYKESGVEIRKVVLGYVQRGGNPSMMDRLRAVMLGHEAVRLIKEGVEGVAVGIKDDHVIHMNLKDALDIPAASPLELINLFENLSH